jgi:hypothetical protein
MYIGDGGELCLKVSQRVHTFYKNTRKGEKGMKMTKDEAKDLAKRGIEVSKKYNIPLKPKKKKKA